VWAGTSILIQGAVVGGQNARIAPTAGYVQVAKSTITRTTFSIQNARGTVSYEHTAQFI
jgi:hypothetical protein